MNPARLADGAVAAVHRIGQHEVGAVRVQQPLAFGRDVGRDAEADREAARGAEHGVGDAGIAGRRVEQRCGRCIKRPGPFALEHHGQGGAVLDRPARVLRFELGVNLDAGPGLEPPQAQQRRPAYEGRQAGQF